jgi:hypothetical protein
MPSSHFCLKQTHLAVPRALASPCRQMGHTGSSASAATLLPSVWGPNHSRMIEKYLPTSDGSKIKNSCSRRRTEYEIATKNLEEFRGRGVWWGEHPAKSERVFAVAASSGTPGSDSGEDDSAAVSFAQLAAAALAQSSYTPSLCQRGRRLGHASPRSTASSTGDACHRTSRGTANPNHCWPSTKPRRLPRELRGSSCNGAGRCSSMDGALTAIGAGGHLPQICSGASDGVANLDWYM